MCNLMQTSGHAVTAEQSGETLINPSSRWTVRPATLSDCDAIASIHNEYVGSGPYTMEETRWTRLSVKALLDHAGDREAMLVCVNDDGEVAGWAKIKHYSDREGYRIACETSVYVSGRARGQGVGDLLLGDTLALAHRLGYRHTTARIIVGNSPSLRLHLKHGFEIVGVQRGIGIIDGEPADVILLQHTGQ